MKRLLNFVKWYKNEANFPFIKAQRKLNSYIVKVLYTTDGVGKKHWGNQRIHSQRSNSLYQNTARALTPRKKHSKGCRDILRPIQAQARWNWLFRKLHFNVRQKPVLCHVGIDTWQLVGRCWLLPKYLHLFKFSFQLHIGIYCIFFRGSRKYSFLYKMTMLIQSILSLIGY